MLELEENERILKEYYNKLTEIKKSLKYESLISNLKELEKKTEEE